MDKLSNLELIELIKAYISKDDEEKQKQEKKNEIFISDELKYNDDFTFNDYIDYDYVYENLMTNLNYTYNYTYNFTYDFVKTKNNNNTDKKLIHIII